MNVRVLMVFSTNHTNWAHAIWNAGNTTHWTSRNCRDQKPSERHSLLNLVCACAICAKYQTGSIMEPMILSKLLLKLSKIGMDLFELRGNHFLLVVDYLLKWPELAKLESLTSKCVITHVKSMISKYRSQTSLLVIMGHRSTVTNSRSLWNRFTSHIPRPVRTMLRVIDRRNEWFWPWNAWSTNHNIHIYRFWRIWAPRLMVLTCLQPSYFWDADWSLYLAYYSPSIEIVCRCQQICQDEVSIGKKEREL